ncbi:hypothetical protein ANCDUO_00108 [Ancylostoma duodenale]|uniref:Adt-1/2-like domain-containing protein n=1 Tax=Ancylostoma duodenale TaxID=51022 RepID=A0A0C2HCW0_9BILA|nr:hypothetical protein ANCDUO_00108 [Ancylostoma duodenale]
MSTKVDDSLHGGSDDRSARLFNSVCMQAALIAVLTPFQLVDTLLSNIANHDDIRLFPQVFCDVANRLGGQRNYRFFGDNLPDGTSCGYDRYCLDGECLVRSLVHTSSSVRIYC